MRHSLRACNKISVSSRNKVVYHGAYGNTEAIARRFKALKPVLDERMRRMVAAAESLALGYGGGSIVSRATGVSRRAIAAGMKELAMPATKRGRERLTERGIRRRGGGRKRTTETPT